MYIHSIYTVYVGMDVHLLYLIVYVGMDVHLFYLNSLCRNECTSILNMEHI